jgi:hypothetical protein
VREIQPISAIDDTVLEPGPRNEEAREAFEKAVAAELGENG